MMEKLYCRPKNWWTNLERPVSYSSERYEGTKSPFSPQSHKFELIKKTTN